MKENSFEAFHGLGKAQPLLAFATTVFLFSLAGIPLTGGFFAKYYMLLGVIKIGNMLWLVIVAILCAAVSVFYYFRVIQAMYFKEGVHHEEIKFTKSFELIMLANAAIIILLGIHPDWLLSFLNI